MQLTFQHWIATKWLEIDQDNLRRKFSAFIVDFSSLSHDPLGSRRPAQAGVKDSYLLKSGYFTAMLSRVSWALLKLLVMFHYTFCNLRSHVDWSHQLSKASTGTTVVNGLKMFLSTFSHGANASCVEMRVGVTVTLRVIGGHTVFTRNSSYCSSAS